jgi:acylphosphatase
MLQTVSLHITGKVQGVYYRQSARTKALSLGITGWVQNLPGQSVQIIATGRSGQLNEFMEWCKKGPPAAKVNQVTVTEQALEIFEEFMIRR